MTAVYSSFVIDQNTSAAKDIFQKYEFIYQNVIEDETMRDYELAFKHLYTSLKAYFSHNEKDNAEFLEVCISYFEKIFQIFYLKMKVAPGFEPRISGSAIKCLWLIM